MPPMLRYQDAGVNIDAGESLVQRIKPLAQRTHVPGVLGGIGGFGALFELPSGYQKPVLVSGTDGVGTKLKLALTAQKLAGLGQDLVGMCVNDILVQGAKPLFFLDYYATGRLDVELAETIIAGIAEGCTLSGMALIGGETAEMPGLYEQADFDLAGFAVGVVEKDRILPQNIAPGDTLIALASSGPHANGFSLIRKILETPGLSEETLNGQAVLELLLTPTRIYVASLLPLIQSEQIKGLAHITGGGLTDNVPRILPETVTAQIDTHSWEWPLLFTWLQEKGNVPLSEMRRTFNCGVGMVLVVSPIHVPAVLQSLDAQGETAWIMGELQAKDPHHPGPVNYV